MDAWATAADLAQLYGVSKGTIYAWASQDHWRRTRNWPKKYNWADAQDSYERRRHIGTMDNNGTTASG